MQEQSKCRVRRELRRTAEAAVALVILIGQRLKRAADQLLTERDHSDHAGLQRASDGLLKLVRLGLDILTPQLPRVGKLLQKLTEADHAAAALGREVGAGIPRAAVGGEPEGVRPAAAPGDELGRGHVDVVDLRPLLAVHLDRHEVVVEDLRDARVLERLALHHVAPVAG